jgi:hypothetical protein
MRAASVSPRRPDRERDLSASRTGGRCGRCHACCDGTRGRSGTCICADVAIAQAPDTPRGSGRVTASCARRGCRPALATGGGRNCAPHRGRRASRRWLIAWRQGTRAVAFRWLAARVALPARTYCCEQAHGAAAASAGAQQRHDAPLDCATSDPRKHQAAVHFRSSATAPFVGARSRMTCTLPARAPLALPALAVASAHVRGSQPAGAPCRRERRAAHAARAHLQGQALHAARAPRLRAQARAPLWRANTAACADAARARRRARRPPRRAPLRRRATCLRRWRRS